MPHTVKPNFSVRLAVAALSFALLSGMTLAQNAFAQQSDSAGTEDADIKGHVEKLAKPAEGEKVSDESSDKTLSAMAGEGLGKGVSLPTSEEQDAIVEEAKPEPEPEDQTKTASMEFPLPRKLPVQKGKAESDGTVSHGEIGVDWSKWVGTLADRWFQSLKNMEFRSNKVFRTARPALIRFTCYRNGTISNVTLKQTCGIPAYDQMQIESLKRCTPLPAFPEGSIRMSYTLMQGWECHPREAGETDFKPGSYGANFPVEKVPAHAKPHTVKSTVTKAASKPAAKTNSVGGVKPASKLPAKATAKTPMKGKTGA